MEKVTITNSDGSTQDFFPQSYTDAAVASAIAATPAAPAAPVVEPTDVEIDVILSDGTTKKFVPAQ